jgi:hypothetical protein
MNYRLGSHAKDVCKDKHFPEAIIYMAVDTQWGDTRMLKTITGNCNTCGNSKKSLTVVGQFRGTTYKFEIIHCSTCRKVITIHLPYDLGVTPIRKDQAIKSYKRTCNDCGREFTISATTWERLAKQTFHKCKGVECDLIADEHKHLTGAQLPIAKKAS